MYAILKPRITTWQSISSAHASHVPIRFSYPFSLSSHCRGMTKLDELVDRNRFNGIGHTAKIGELDQHNIIVQLKMGTARIV